MSNLQGRVTAGAIITRWDPLPYLMGTLTYRHEWSAGDIVMWDNRCVLHCADHSGVIGDRVMHRGMVADHRSGSSSTERVS